MQAVSSASSSTAAFTGLVSARKAAGLPAKRESLKVSQPKAARQAVVAMASSDNGASGRFEKSGNVVKDELFSNNRIWAGAIRKADPTFFDRLSLGQSPEILWIGCADSRMPAEDLIGKMPGEVFVHRNVANVVVHTDFNCLSVLEYAVKALKVKHIVVCGHYSCGGVMASTGDATVGLVDNWLRHIRDVRVKYEKELDLYSQQGGNVVDKLCELNVIEQVKNVCSTTIVQTAWREGQELSVYGWIYNLKDGLLSDLGVSINDAADIPKQYRLAINSSLSAAPKQDKVPVGASK
eukprot:jgi/Chlat1/2862/Chrsp194S03007